MMDIVERLKLMHGTATTFDAAAVITSLREQLAAAQAECIALQNQNVELKSLVYVPGHRKCAKCGFYLVSTELNATTGKIRANDKPDDCPNGCGPLWPVTERESGNTMVDRYITLQNRNVELDEQVTAWRAEWMAAENKLSAATEWRPIDSAPKDGTPILAYAKGYTLPFVVYWGSEGVVPGGCNTFAKEWILPNAEGCARISYEPTHWLPVAQPEGDAK